MSIPESVICEHLNVRNGILTNDEFNFLLNNGNGNLRSRLYNGKVMAPGCNVEKQQSSKDKAMVSAI